MRIRSSHLRSQDGARGGTSRACTPPPKPKLLKEELRNTGNDQNRDSGRDWQLGVAFIQYYHRSCGMNLFATIRWAYLVTLWSASPHVELYLKITRTTVTNSFNIYGSVHGTESDRRPATSWLYVIFFIRIRHLIFKDSNSRSGF